ncbi:MAG: hypothetical protein A3K65_07780 [Euryarchaeota archaeon RBG_16_68_12]|nr:MAG: hypothetical protein A3K65_07780 [Euryarchaeota archaeon RBG_16_68_12]
MSSARGRPRSLWGWDFLYGILAPAVTIAGTAAAFFGIRFDSLDFSVAAVAIYSAGGLAVLVGALTLALVDRGRRRGQRWAEPTDFSAMVRLGSLTWPIAFGVDVLLLVFAPVRRPVDLSRLAVVVAAVIVFCVFIGLALRFMRNEILQSRGVRRQGFPQAMERALSRFQTLVDRAEAVPGPVRRDPFVKWVVRAEYSFPTGALRLLRAGRRRIVVELRPTTSWPALAKTVDRLLSDNITSAISRSNGEPGY